MTIKSFVKIKPLSDKGPFTNGFNEIRKGINRTGEVTESIGKNFVETHKLIQFQKEWLSDVGQEKLDDINDEDKKDKLKQKSFLDKFFSMFRRNKRKEAERTAEQAEKDADKETLKRQEEIKKPVKGFLKTIAGFLTPIFDFFVKYAVFSWLSTHGKQAEKIMRVVFNLAKFAFKISGWGIFKIMDGLTNMFGIGFGEGPVKRGFRFIGGALQLVGGLAALKTAQYMIMPWKLFQDINFVREVFFKQAEQGAEASANAAWRQKGYRDKKTGVIYSKREYEQMQKSARRAGKEKIFNRRVAPTATQRGRNLKAGFLKKTRGARKFPGRVAKGVKGNFLKPGFQKGFAVFGGITRAATGIASGEDATQAVGAGIGQAAGGLLGAAAGTALLGPFLGPFAPIVGNAIGSFLGEWLGKTFIPLLKPLFEPVKRYFTMLWDIVKGIAKETGISEFLQVLFKAIGQLGGLLMKAAKWLADFVGFVLGTALKVVGKVIQFVINNAKRLMDPKSVLAGIGDALTFNAFNLDGYEEGGLVTVKNRVSIRNRVKWMSMGGLVTGAALAGILGLTMPALAEGGHVVTSKMGMRDFALSPGMHMGVDIAAATGEELVAFTDGEVEDCGWDGGYGYYVSWIDDKGYGHFYAHLMEPCKVKKGQKLTKGQVVGYVGNTGRSEGPHLHWEMATNPADTGMPKSAVLSRMNPLDYYGKESPFGGAVKKILKNDSVYEPVSHKQTTEDEKPIPQSKQHEVFGGLEKAFAQLGAAFDSPGGQSIRERRASTFNQAPTVIKHNNVSGSDIKSMVMDRNQAKTIMDEKAFRDKQMDNFVPPVMTITRQIRQPIINNSGGGSPAVVRTKPIPMLTC